MTIELLQSFVADCSDHREYLRAPFSKGDWIYATNGHIAVRVPKSEGITATESDTPKNIEEIFEKNKRDSFVDLPELPAAEACPTCNGSGIGYKCPDCDGKGQFEHGSHTYDCAECDSSGQVYDGWDDYKEPCLRCGGNGEERYKPVSVGSWHYDRRYLAKIEKLPGVRFAQRKEGPATGDDSAVAYFVFDGGDGVLMPMRV